MKITKKAVKAPKNILPDNWHKVRWPKMLSSKKDGIRCLIPPCGIPTGYSGKPIRNPRFMNHFREIMKYATANDIIIDGEIWSANRDYTFQDLLSVTAKAKHGGKEIPSHVHLFVFELLTREEWETEKVSTTFLDRWHQRLIPLQDEGLLHCVVLDQHFVTRESTAQAHLTTEERIGGEGCMLRDPKATYKFGRHTVTENELLKLKFVEHADGKVVGFVQGESKNDDVEKEYGPTGELQTTNKQQDKHLIEALGALVVETEAGVRFNVGGGFNYRGGDKDRGLLWKRRHGLMGKWCTFSYQPVGIKEKPRQPIFVRWRDSK